MDNVTDFDSYIQKIRSVEEKRPEERTEEEKQFLRFINNGPSYNGLFNIKKEKP